MALEVLLMADVKDLGSEGDIVNVADGYARNYLLPRKLAAPATIGMKRRLTKIREQREVVRKTEVNAARKLAEELKGVSCTLAVKVSEGETMYGSVTTADIVEALKKQGVTLDKAWLTLGSPIKQLGVYDVEVRLHPEVAGTVKVWVVEE